MVADEQGMARLSTNLGLKFTDLKSVFNDIVTGYTPTNPQGGTFRDFSKLENLDTPTPLDNNDINTFFNYLPNIPTTDSAENQIQTIQQCPMEATPNEQIVSAQNGNLIELKSHLILIQENTECNSTPLAPLAPNPQYEMNVFMDKTIITPPLGEQNNLSDTFAISSEQIHGKLSSQNENNKFIESEHYPVHSKYHVTEPESKKHEKPKVLEKAFTCPTPNCLKRFARIDELKRHQRTHSDVKQFVCDICTRGFTRSDHLMTHRRTHTGERPYACEYCEKRFARSDERNRHTKVHFRVKARSKWTSRQATISSGHSDSAYKFFR